MGVHACTSALGGPQRPVGKQEQCQWVIQVGQDPHAQDCSSVLPCPALGSLFPSVFISPTQALP